MHMRAANSRRLEWWIGGAARNTLPDLLHGADYEDVKKGESMTTYAKRADGNQTEIVEALRQVGTSVEHLHTIGGGVPDLLCGRSSPCPYCGAHFPQTYLIEIKTEKNWLNARQRNWRAAWRGQLAVVRTIGEALAAVGVKI
jgi:hypothetical protein